MRKLINKLALTVVATILTCVSPTFAQDKGLPDPRHDKYVDTMKGKKVVYIPIGMGYDLSEGWWAGLKRELLPLGIELEIRDPNWSVDAGVRTLTSLIGERPDLIMVQSPDEQSYSRVLRKAEKEGLHVVQIQMHSSHSSDIFVGADWIQVGEEVAKLAAKQCGPDSSGKVAIMQGVLTASASIFQVRGVYNILDQHPHIQVVSNQAADWDASKARAIMETVVQQHPDLCAAIGFWDTMDVGTSAAIKEAGLKDDIFVVTSGGGHKDACDNLENGTFDVAISYDVPRQALELANAARALLQVESKAGAFKYSHYSPLTIMTKENLNVQRRNGACWTKESVSGN
ncbi:substrate-binding domain-containing protein [Rhodobacteraceae bacterium Araon29]